jgi:hypothetical protein
LIAANTQISGLTPQSSMVQLRKCPGCELHDASVSATKVQIPASISDADALEASTLNCRISRRHNEIMLLEDKTSRSNRPHFNCCGINQLPYTYFGLNNLVTQFFNATQPGNSNLVSIIQETQDLLPYFLHNGTYTPINKRLRYFMNECFTARCFANIIQLDRFSNFLTLHMTQSINWNATWSLLLFVNRDFKSSMTSFEQSFMHV